MTAPSKAEFDELLSAALAMNDAIDLHDDHAEFTGSMNQAEAFREVVNRLWHKRRFSPEPTAAPKFETGPGGLWRDERGNWREPGSGIRGGGA